MRYAKMSKGRNEHGKEWADIGRLLATWIYSDDDE